MANRFDPETHTFYINEIEVPHITGLLPEQERYVSNEQYENARIRGSDNHSMIKMYLDTREIFNDPMLLAFDIMLKENANKFGELKLYETPLFSKEYMFGGIPDLVFENAKIEIKLNFNNKFYHALQIAGQEILTNENKIAPNTMNWYVAFYKDAKFRLKDVYDPEAKSIFLNLLDQYYTNKRVQNYLKGESK